jgi:hypothetical protein
LLTDIAVEFLFLIQNLLSALAGYDIPALQTLTSAIFSGLTGSPVTLRASPGAVLKSTYTYPAKVKVETRVALS